MRWTTLGVAVLLTGCATGNPFSSTVNPFSTKVPASWRSSGGQPEILQLRPTHLLPPGEVPAKIPYIHKDSAADKAGMQSGDVIVQVNGQQVHGLSDAEKFVSEMNGEGTIQVSRESRLVDLKLHMQESVPSGIVFLPERYAARFPDGRYTDTQLKGGVAVGIVGAATTKNSSAVSFILWVINHSDKMLVISPQDLLVLDSYNSILRFYSANDLAAAVDGAAQSRFNAYSQFSSAQVAAAASQPPTYNITGASNTYGGGNMYSYGRYGYYNYSGSTYSSYQATPQPNYAATGAMFGQAIGLMVAKNRLKREQETAQSLRANAFEFGEIPPGTNRRGLVLCDSPSIYPLQIRVTLNGNTYSFELDKEEQGNSSATIRNSTR